MPVAEAAGIFATIVGLMADYKQETDARKQQKYQDYIEWLKYHRHEDLKNLICNNAALLNEVNPLIRGDTQALVAKVGALDQALALIASQNHEFKGLAAAVVRPENQNPEAIELLKKLVGCGIKKFGVGSSMRTRKDLLIFEGGEGVQFQHESSFFEDDLETWLNGDFYGKTTTRAGMKCSS